MKTALTILVGSAVVSLAYYVGVQNAQPTTSKTVIVKEYVIAPASANAADTAMGAALPFGQSIAAPVPTAQPNELGVKMMLAKDMKSYAIEMLKHENVKLGGAFYATRALMLCNGYEEFRNRTDTSIQRVVAEKTTITAEQLAMVKEGEKKCGSLSMEEFDTLFNQALRQALPGADPLLKLTMAKGPNRLSAIVEYKSLALASVTETPFLLLGEKRIATDGGITTVFNGQTYGPEYDKMLDVAALLSTCVEGDYCKLEAERLSTCWYEAECYPTREAFVQARYLKGNQQQMDKVLVFAHQMRQALVAGDSSVFK